MSILINEKTRVLVQGITGKQGSFHTEQMLAYGTNIVAGVTPGKAGQEVHGVPVYDSVEECPKADVAVIFVPARFAANAALESFSAGLFPVIITEHIPVLDVMELTKKGSFLGPNCPGLASPGKSKVGIIPNSIMKNGNVGIVSRSGTLTYEIISLLSNSGLGQSTVVGIGGDAINGMGFVDVLKEFEKDEETEKIVLIGEIGGSAEEEAAAFLEGYSKPVVAYIAGRSAPAGKTMGHAGAIVYGNKGTAKSKVEALEKAGVPVARLPSEVLKLL